MWLWINVDYCQCGNVKAELLILGNMDIQFVRQCRVWAVKAQASLRQCGMLQIRCQTEKEKVVSVCCG